MDGTKKGYYKESDMRVENVAKQIGRLTQHIRYGLTPLHFGTLIPSVATSYMLETLYEMAPLILKGEKFNGNKEIKNQR